MKVATSLAQAHTLAQQAEVKRWCKDRGLPVPEFEVLFAPARKWRFDVAWVHQRVAMEIDGGVWVRGRHARGAGILKDQEKLNAACALGWRVLRTTPATLAETTKAARVALGLDDWEAT